MNFTKDWFSHNIPNFQHIKAELGTVNCVLEIGAFEGRASCWMLENMIADDGKLFVIDTFKGSEEHTELNLNELRTTFDANVAEAKKETQAVRVYAEPSYEALGQLAYKRFIEAFDFIYIDGSHTAPDVLTDACMAFPLLKSGGVMLFDDYMWMDIVELLHRPKIAVDSFTTIFAEKCKVRMVGYQLAIQKD